MLSLVQCMPPPAQSDKDVERRCVGDYFEEYVSRLHQTLQAINKTELGKFIQLVRDAFRHKNTIFLIGNGGSAACASHWANDLSKGLFHRANLTVRAISLTDNVSLMTAIANDISFEEVFSDQLRTLGKKGDLLIAITVSGNSQNIIRAIELAKQRGIKTLALVGFDGGKTLSKSDYAVHIKSEHGAYGLVEDIQMILGHFLADYLYAHRTSTLSN